MTIPKSFPKRIACVDTGSNAIRFQIADFTGPTEYELLLSERIPVRLGHQVFLSGRLALEQMEAAVEAFIDFRAKMDEMGVESYRAVATSAVREAHNGHVLQERISREANIRLETITGSEEARLVHLAVHRQIDLTRGKWILADLGGGSVEVSLVDDSGILWSESHTMGSVRLLEELSTGGLEAGGFQRLLAEYVSVLRIPSSTQYWEPQGFICTGGNIESLADLGAPPTDTVGTRVLAVADLEAWIARLATMSYNERIEKLNLRSDRADVILPAAIVYHRLAILCGVESILVPGVGVKEGILFDLADDLSSHSGHEARQSKQVLTAAVALGRRFMFDEHHGLKVAHLAGVIFDATAPLHGLSARDKLMLEAACILHDIGFFISHEKHHKHSLYIISRSALPGLSEEEMLIVANLARYHRKSQPAPHHDQYMRLPYPTRMRVLQMASILKLADSLDRQHIQAVLDIDVTLSGRSMNFALTGTGDLLLERWAFSRKKEFFEETFGIQAHVSMKN